MDSRARERISSADSSGSSIRRRSFAPVAPRTHRDSEMEAAQQEQLNKRRLSTPQPTLARRSSSSSSALRTRGSVQKHLSGNRTAKPLSAGSSSSSGGGSNKRIIGRGTYAGARDSDSGSDSEEHDGFVKVDAWKAPSEPLLATFKPTIPPSNIPVFNSNSAAGTRGQRLAPRMRSPPTAPRAQTAKAPDAPKEPQTSEKVVAAPSVSDSDSSCSDEEISDVLDETEIQLIEAMEDTRITGEKDKEAAGATQARATAPGVNACSMPLRWVGIGQGPGGARASFAESLKERFSAKSSTTSISVSHDNHAQAVSDSDSSDDETTAPPLAAVPPLAPTLADETDATNDAEATKQEIETKAVNAQPLAAATSAPALTTAAAETPFSSRSEGSSSRAGDSDSEEVPRSSSVPLDTVEFVAPGVAKDTAMSLLRRVLDIDSPIIQQKMVEFLLIDGVMASLIGFITHCQGSVFTPTLSTQTAPCSPSVAPGSRASHPGEHTATGVDSDAKLQSSVLQEFERRQQHRERLRRQRTRSGGLSEADLRRAYNAVQMLTSRDPCARRVVEAKLSVIVPSLMAVFDKDALGSFHHACVLLEHCFTLAPLKTARLMLYQQNPASRWWRSEAVAQGLAPICDVLPYLSETCVQRLFLKAEFGVWTGRLMVSLNLAPNDAVVVADELSRIGLGAVAGALGAGDEGSGGASKNQQRNNSMQLVRNRFQQLNRGGFLEQMLELIEDSDPEVAGSVGEFMAGMINDCAAFVGFNILFKPIYDSERPTRRLAQLIINSPAARLTAQARAAVQLLQALLGKTSCMYGQRAREAQGMRDYELHARGSQVLLCVGQAARSALESFLPGLLATVTGQQANTDLTSHSAYNRRASVESLQLPEYGEADPDLDADETEAESTSSSSSDSDSDGAQSLGANERSERALRDSAAALLGAAYPESMGSGSISSSLSPSSTLSASPVAVASTTPPQPDLRGERLDAEDLGLLAALPKPDAGRLSLLRVCIEVLREADDVDGIVGWVDLRVWRALSTWFLNHPHNNILHMAVYQLVSTVVLEAVRQRRARRAAPVPVSVPIPASASGAGKARTDSASGSEYFSAHSARQQHAARRRRAAAERMRYEEASNCDNVLTYLVEQHGWVGKLVRRAGSGNFDGAHGYISLILNTLRLAVQADRRRIDAHGGPRGRASKRDEAVPAADCDKLGDEDKLGEINPDGDILGDEDKLGELNPDGDKLGEISPDGDKLSDSDDDEADQAYHDPATRARRGEYPLYRLQRWEIGLLYSGAFRGHVRQLRRQARLMARRLTEFQLRDQEQKEVARQRPVPFFSPQRVRPPAAFDGTEIKRKQMQISMGLLLGNRRAAAAGSGPSVAAVGDDDPGLDEAGVDLDSLYARMLGFTEDLVAPAAVAAAKSAAAAGGGAKARGAGGRASGGRRKKTRVLSEAGAEAAEALCSALASGSRVGPAAGRGRRKAASGTVRRRRARLQRASSAGAGEASGLAASMQTLELDKR
ncbi:hypothetical protein H4S02_003920 [Coemansia sp. RSA 2611]|nr:hypothetical protein H4S02_003920 [Coemansia sp. RSA 2611]